MKARARRPTPRRARVPKTRPVAANDCADIAGEAAHAINNAIGILFGAEYALKPDAASGATERLADALLNVREASAKLQRSTDALNLLAQRAADLRIPRRTAASALSAMLEQLCADIHVPLHWPVHPALTGELALDRELARWLVSCAIASLGRGTPRDTRVEASIRKSRGALVLTIDAKGPAATAASARPNLQTLVLKRQRALLGAAGVRVGWRRTTEGQSVSLSFPVASPGRRDSG